MSWFLIVALVGCLERRDDSGATDGGAASACPELDCRDQLTLTVLGVDGSPSGFLEGALSPPDASPIPFWCGAELRDFEGGQCLGGGQVGLWVYGERFGLWVDEGDDAPWWSGTLAPTWDAPYDSPECGHYCWRAAETVTLLPCDGCG